MESPEVYRLLSRRIRRGRYVFGTQALVFPVAGGVALATGRGSWAVAAFLTGLLLALGFHQVRERDASARSVAENPDLVYWAHPTMIPPQNHWLFGFTPLRFLMLHLRDGRQLEAGLLPDEMSSFMAWLIQHNPTIRMGAYDNTRSA